MLLARHTRITSLLKRRLLLASCCCRQLSMEINLYTAKNTTIQQFKWKMHELNAQRRRIYSFLNIACERSSLLGVVILCPTTKCRTNLPCKLQKLIPKYTNCLKHPALEGPVPCGFPVSLRSGSSGGFPRYL